MTRIHRILAGTVALLVAAVQPVQADAPGRVVSINLCTDQLAMLLAAPGQLLSVSHVASDPRSSAMANQAGNYRMNHGLAEEIYVLQPDLVVAGTWTPHSTVSMLERLGVPVAVFQPARTLADIRERLVQMGEVLERPAVAETMVAEFDVRLAALQEHVSDRPRAALYYANGYTAGDQTLAGQILLAAGFANAADEAGYRAGMKMPLEMLAMIAPETVIAARRYPGGSRSEEILDHPVLGALRSGSTMAAMTDQDWVCGTPYVLRAVEELARIRRGMTGADR